MAAIDPIASATIMNGASYTPSAGCEIPRRNAGYGMPHTAPSANHPYAARRLSRSETKITP